MTKLIPLLALVLSINLLIGCDESGALGTPEDGDQAERIDELAAMVDSLAARLEQIESDDLGVKLVPVDLDLSESCSIFGSSGDEYVYWRLPVPAGSAMVLSEGLIVPTRVICDVEWPTEPDLIETQDGTLWGADEFQWIRLQAHGE